MTETHELTETNEREIPKSGKSFNDSKFYCKESSGLRHPSKESVTTQNNLNEAKKDLKFKVAVDPIQKVASGNDTLLRRGGDRPQGGEFSQKGERSQPCGLSPSPTSGGSSQHKKKKEKKKRNR